MSNQAMSPSLHRLLHLLSNTARLRNHEIRNSLTTDLYRLDVVPNELDTYLATEAGISSVYLSDFLQLLIFLDAMTHSLLSRTNNRHRSEAPSQSKSPNSSSPSSRSHKNSTRNRNRRPQPDRRAFTGK